jgi:hypothetical protein
VNTVKKIDHNNAMRVIGGNNMVCSNAQYFWIRDDDGSGNNVCLKREECSIPGDKYGNSPIVFNKVAASFCGK